MIELPGQIREYLSEFCTSRIVGRERASGGREGREGARGEGMRSVTREN